MSRRFLTKRRQKAIISVIALLLTLSIYAAQDRGWLGGAEQAAVSSQPGLYRVTQFVDGDTIAIDMNGHTEKVRFIGVDTPETHKPNTPVQCYGPAASAYTKQQIGSQSVRLESDSLNTDRDRYDRLLRYVYLPDGTLLNKKLIENGYGFYYPYFPFSKKDEFAAAQTTAQASYKGLWGNCTPTQTDKGGYLSNTQ
jgi:micrococcal nuclease